MTQAIPASEYRQIIKRALVQRPSATAQEREDFYRLARVSLSTMLLAANPPFAEERVADETRRLEGVIADVEAEFQPSAGSQYAEPSLRLVAGLTNQRGSAAFGQGEDTAGAVLDTSRTRASLGAVTAAVRRRFEGADPTLPAILEFQRPSTAIVNAPMPVAARAVTWLITSMVVALIGLAASISIDQVVTARGIVVSKSPTLLVQPLETSIVKSIDVSEGEVVHAGQALAELDPTFAAADLTAMTSQASSLSAEAARLTAELAGKPFDYDGQEPDWLLQFSIYGHRQAELRLKLENYEQKIGELNATISRAQSDIVGYSKRAEIAQTVENMRKELEVKQVGTKINTLAAVDARAEMERARAAAQQALQSALRDKQALEAERDSFKQSQLADVARQLSETQRKLSDTREALSKAKLRRSLVQLRADRDGVVQSLAKVSVGSVLQSGQPFITIVPVGASLEVEANIPGSENGYVHLGDPVAIKFDTFPFSQYGMARGAVRTVSPNSFTAEDEARNPSSLTPVGGMNEPYYRARLTIDEIGLHGTPPGFRLIPGMPVTADIKVGRRTILKYLLGRVLPIAQEGLREPEN